MSIYPLIVLLAALGEPDLSKNFDGTDAVPIQVEVQEVEPQTPEEIAKAEKAKLEEKKRMKKFEEEKKEMEARAAYRKVQAEDVARVTAEREAKAKAKYATWKAKQDAIKSKKLPPIEARKAAAKNYWKAKNAEKAQKTGVK